MPPNQVSVTTLCFLEGFVSSSPENASRSESSSDVQQISHLSSFTSLRGAGGSFSQDKGSQSRCSLLRKILVEVAHHQWSLCPSRFPHAKAIPHYIGKLSSFMRGKMFEKYIT